MKGRCVKGHSHPLNSFLLCAPEFHISPGSLYEATKYQPHVPGGVTLCRNSLYTCLCGRIVLASAGPFGILWRKISCIVLTGIQSWPCKKNKMLIYHPYKKENQQQILYLSSCWNLLWTASQYFTFLFSFNGLLIFSASNAPSSPLQLLLVFVVKGISLIAFVPVKLSHF